MDVVLLFLAFLLFYHREQMDPSEVHRFKSRVEVLESRCERLENDLADAR